MRFKKLIFFMFFSIISFFLQANSIKNLPRTNEDARSLFYNFIERNSDFSGYILNEDTDKTKIGLTFWKLDINNNIWYSVTNSKNSQDFILKINLTNNHFNLYSPDNDAFNITNNYKILNFEVSKDGILFLDLKNWINLNRKIISLNTKNNSEIEVLIDFHGYEYWGNNSLCYSNKTDKLYIESYGAAKNINNIDLFYDSGFYIYNRVNGKFSREGMERVFSLPEWIITNAVIAFTNKGTLNYRAFLDWLYYYCDYGEKTFVYERDDGIYTDIEGLRHFIEDGLYKNDAVYLSQYLKKIKDGKITEETALSCVLKYPQSYPRYVEYQPYTAWLLQTDAGMWLFKENAIQSVDEKGGAVWKTTFYTPYLIEDSNGNYPDIEERPLKSTRIDFDNSNQTIEKIYGALVYKDKDNAYWGVYKNNSLFKFEEYKDAVTSAKKIAEGKTVKVHENVSYITIYLLVIAVIIILVLIFIIIFILSKKFSQHLSKNDKRFIFKIQEAERTKLSRDIHDSVVQNIRAIRLDAEMLKVLPEEEEQKKKVVAEMTDIISLLRNICYNFRPAELSVESDNTELISIIDTLCQQFISRTKIPCHIQIQKDFQSPKMDTEKSTNIVRVVQEALANIEKHSYATNVQIIIKSKGQERKYLVIFIIDDGIGCDVNKLGRNKMNFGIRNMKERMKAVGGELEFFSTANEGLSVQLIIPYEDTVCN
ncbi:MAG: sensor histidine kinase [Treponema sp.]|nr:sensor histidine kinase [Treponema sp.]